VPEDLVSRILFVPWPRGSGRRPFIYATYPENVPRRERPESGRTTRSVLPIWSCSTWGLPSPRAVAGRAVRSYRTLSPLPALGPRGPFGPEEPGPAVYSLLHFPSRHRALPLASMASVGVRTFLPRRFPAGSDRIRSSGRPKTSSLRGELAAHRGLRPPALPDRTSPRETLRPSARRRALPDNSRPDRSPRPSRGADRRHGRRGADAPKRRAEDATDDLPRASRDAPGGEGVGRSLAGIGGGLDVDRSGWCRTPQSAHPHQPVTQCCGSVGWPLAALKERAVQREVMVRRSVHGKVSARILAGRRSHVGVADRSKTCPRRPCPRSARSAPNHESARFRSSFSSASSVPLASLTSRGS